MTFDEIWQSAAIGASLAVSNGKPQPPGGLGSPRYNIWRSHNFSGELVAKIVGPPRVLRVRDAANPHNVAYDVADDGAHTFTLAE